VKGVEWSIKKLKEKGIIKRIDYYKGGYWKIKKANFKQLTTDLPSLYII